MVPDEAESFFLAAVLWLQISPGFQTASDGGVQSEAAAAAEREIAESLRKRLADPVYENVLGAQLIRAFLDYPQNQDFVRKTLEQCAEKRNEAFRNFLSKDASALFWYIGYPLAHFSYVQLQSRYPDAEKPNIESNANRSAPGQIASLSSAFSAGFGESRALPFRLWSFLPDMVNFGQFVSEDSMRSMVVALPLIGPLELSAGQSPLSKQWTKDWIDWEFVVKLGKDKRGVDCSLNGKTIHLQNLEEYLISVAETLHDYELDEYAIAVMDKIPEQNRRPEKNARYWYYRACLYQREKKGREQWEAVCKALEQDSHEVDSLIMRWEMCQQSQGAIQTAKLDQAITPTIQESQEKEIDEYLDQLEQKMDANQGTSSLQNEYAWLAVKTSRKIPTALEYAQQAVASNPQSAACMDTLAHILAVKNEWEEAVKTQKQAIQQDPFSHTLYTTLLRFQKEAQKKLKENDNK